MKKIKTSVNPFATLVSETNVKNDLQDLRRLAKVLNMIVDKADNKQYQSDENILIASMYPSVPHITFGQVRAAMEEVEMIETAHKEAAMTRASGSRGKRLAKDLG